MNPLCQDSCYLDRRLDRRGGPGRLAGRDPRGGRRRPKAEKKHPQLLADIHEIMEPASQAEPRLRTNLQYTDMTAPAVYEALLEKGWSEETLPSVRTISNILNRHGYRLRAVAKTKVQKKRN